MSVTSPAIIMSIVMLSAPVSVHVSMAVTMGHLGGHSMAVAVTTVPAPARVRCFPLPARVASRAV